MNSTIFVMDESVFLYIIFLVGAVVARFLGSLTLLVSGRFARGIGKSWGHGPGSVSWDPCSFSPFVAALCERLSGRRYVTPPRRPSNKVQFLRARNIIGLSFA